MRNTNKYICPVCGYNDLDESPYDEMGCPSYDICPSCGTEYGYDDSSTSNTLLKERWASLRDRWIKSGMKWWNNNKKMPIGWNPQKQLTNLKYLEGNCKYNYTIKE